MQGLTGIGHVALKVHDLKRSLHFYRDLLGFPEMMHLDKPGGSGLWLVYLRITDTQFIEIFPGAPQERAPDWDDNAITHICIEVENLDATLAELARAGIPLIVDKKMAADRNWQAWVADPDGNRIEFMQMAPDSMQRQAIARLHAEGR